MARSTAARIRAYQQYLDEIEQALNGDIQEATRKMTAQESAVRDSGGRQMEAILRDMRTIGKRREALQQRLDRGGNANDDGQLPILYQSFVPTTRRDHTQLGDADIDEEGWVELGAEGDAFWDVRLEEDPEHEVKAAAAKKISVLRQQEAELEERVKALQAKNRNFAEKIEELAAADRKELRVRRECLETECEGGIDGTAAQKKQWSKIVQQYLGETYKIRVNAEWRKIAGKEREAFKRAGSPKESDKHSKRRYTRNSSTQEEVNDDETDTQADSGLTTPAVAPSALNVQPGTDITAAEDDDDAGDNGSDASAPEVPEVRERRVPRKKLRSIKQSDTRGRGHLSDQPTKKSKRSCKSMAEEDDEEYQDDSEPESSPPPLRRLTRGRARPRASIAPAEKSQSENELIEPSSASTPAQDGEGGRSEEYQQEKQTGTAMEELGPDHAAMVEAMQRGESGADYAFKFNLKIALAHEFLEESDLIVKSRSGEWVELHCPMCKGNTQAAGELAITGFNFFRNHLDIVHDINEPDDQELVELCTKRVCDFDYIRSIVKGGVKPVVVYVKAPGEIDEEEQEQDGVDTGSGAGGAAKSDVADAGDDEEQDLTVAPTWDFSTLG